MTLSSSPCLFGLVVSLILNSIAYGGSDVLRSDLARPRSENQVAGNTDLHIECVAPGKAGAISLPINGTSVCFALRHGVTSFIFHLAARGQPRCITVENENLTAQGRFSIAISNERLAVDNTQWKAIGAEVPFRHKRHFDLSLVGVDAEFVKVTFQVDQPGKIEPRDGSDRTAQRFTAQP